MKREILCVPCSEHIRKVITGLHFVELTEGRSIIVDPYPGEHSKFVFGKVRPYVTIRCDHCNQRLFVDTDACALSIWADYGGGPYYEWEDDFLNIGD